MPAAAESSGNGQKFVLFVGLFLFSKNRGYRRFFGMKKDFTKKFLSSERSIGIFFAYLLPAILCGAKSLSRHPLIPNSSSFCMEEEEAKSNHSNSLET